LVILCALAASSTAMGHSEAVPRAKNHRQDQPTTSVEPGATTTSAPSPLSGTTGTRTTSTSNTTSTRRASVLATTPVVSIPRNPGSSGPGAANLGNTATVGTSGHPTTPGTQPSLGAYAGTNNRAGVDSFASTTGAHVSLAETYLPSRAYTGPNYGSEYGWGYLTTDATLASWLSTWIGTKYQMVIGVPMVALNGSGDPENTLAQGAAGDENANFVAIARNLVFLGFGNAILRLGWEFDGTWYPWTVRSNADAANFASYWQKIVIAMRAVPGANFTYLWSPAGFQSLAWNINNAYPGNSYVDYVSFDVYDWSWNGAIFPSGDPGNSATVAQSNAVFQNLLTDPLGLNWLASFAQAQNKPIVIPEWAVTLRKDGNGLGDDQTFINNMHSWFISNHVSWVIYFIDDAADNLNQGVDFLITDGNFPSSLAAFTTDFG
jgi:hypothetical protein